MPDIIFMYSGLGSQYYQMGKTLFAENPVFKNTLLDADQYYKEKMGFSLLEHFYNDKLKKHDPFTQTLLTFPAVFMVEYALTQVLMTNGVVPSIVLGASMGVYAAAVTAGILDFEATFSVIIKQAQLFETLSPGGMLAILANPNIYNSEPYLYEHSDLAAINFDSHFVVAGNLENLNNITEKLNQEAIIHQMLWVTKAFHSHLVDSVRVSFLETLKQLSSKQSKISFISCATPKLTHSLTDEDYWNAVRQPIMFQDAMRAIDQHRPAIFIDVGPAGTLANFAKYNLFDATASRVLTMLSPLGNDSKNLQKILNTTNKRE